MKWRLRQICSKNRKTKLAASEPLLSLGFRVEELQREYSNSARPSFQLVLMRSHCAQFTAHHNISVISVKYFHGFYQQHVQAAYAWGKIPKRKTCQQLQHKQL